MIMDSFGRYPVETAHDHEQGPEVGAATAEARERVVALAAVYGGPPSLANPW